ncbi:hypothetical protein EDB19DRAFT_1914088 [Suillus lakei]|nr:hypothetical protein EDB19DRAFT_1914088 [Suillus lakei]
MLSNPPSGLAAIDTGTTFIRAPTPSIWAQVPGSAELTGDFQGIYTFRHLYVLRRYNWAISPLNMDLGTLSDTMIGNANTTSLICAGGIFDIGIGSTPA